MQMVLVYRKQWCAGNTERSISITLDTDEKLKKYIFVINHLNIFIFIFINSFLRHLTVSISKDRKKVKIRPRNKCLSQ